MNFYNFVVAQTQITASDTFIQCSSFFLSLLLLFLSVRLLPLVAMGWKEVFLSRINAFCTSKVQAVCFFHANATLGSLDVIVNTQDWHTKSFLSNDFSVTQNKAHAFSCFGSLRILPSLRLNFCSLFSVLPFCMVC
jgi:hypothetical protein